MDAWIVSVVSEGRIHELRHLAPTLKTVKKKRNIGRVARGPEIIKAPIQKVYNVITDFDHYTDWSGNGIKYMKYAQRTPKFKEINYITGVFGILFHFSLYWAMTPNEQVIFRSTKPSRLLHFMRGEYKLKKIGPNQTEVSFVITADILAPIPDFVKYGIARLICDIAIGFLKRYVEGAECDANLRKYGLWPPNAGGWRQRMTQLMTNAGTHATQGVVGGVMNFPPIALVRSVLRRSTRLVRETILMSVKLVVKSVLMTLHNVAQVVDKIKGGGERGSDDIEPK